MGCIYFLFFFVSFLTTKINVDKLVKAEGEREREGGNGARCAICALEFLFLLRVFFFILFSVRLFFRFENGRWLFEVNEWLLKLRRLLLRTRDINQVISFSSAWRNGNISKNTYTARICLRLLAAAQRTAMSNYITACVYLSSSSSFSALPLPRLMIGHYTNTTEDDCDWHSPLVLLSRSLRYVCSARTAQTDGRMRRQWRHTMNDTLRDVADMPSWWWMGLHMNRSVYLGFSRPPDRPTGSNYNLPRFLSFFCVND